MVLLIANIYAGNLFMLYLDDSRQKGKTILIVCVQIVLSLAVVLPSQILNTYNFKFVVINT